MPARPARLVWRLPLALGGAAVAVQVTVGLLGGSAAVPALGPRASGPRGLMPPWDVAAGIGPWAVTGLLVVAAGLGTAAVALGLRAWRGGARVDLRVVGALGALAVVALVAVPAQGSADHLSYAAYGRIVTGGGDPYVSDPMAWRGGSDPVTSSVLPPWQHTPSVYGPVATAAQALAAWWGGGNLRATVGAWQVLCGLAFAGAAVGLHSWAARAGTADADPGGRDPHARVAVLWTLNPLLLGQLVAGAHLDVLAVAAAVTGLTLLGRRPLAAGLLLGAAVGMKAPFALAVVAAAVSLLDLGLRGPAGARRRAVRTAAWTATGALAVLVPAHVWSGRHTYDQLLTASRFLSLAAPWRIVSDVLDPVLGTSTVRSIVPRVASVLAVALAVVLWRRARVLRPPHVQPASATLPDDLALGSLALRTHLLLATAWVLTAGYVLPWYDAMLWAPAAVVCWSGVVDAALLVRLAVLVLAYVPGLNVGLTPRLVDVTLAFRHYVAPWFTLGVLVVVASWAWRRGSGGASADPVGLSVGERR